MYKSVDKYLHALERVVSVSSTLNQLSATEFNEGVASLLSQKSITNNEIHLNGTNHQIQESNTQKDGATPMELEQNQQ